MMFNFVMALSIACNLAAPFYPWQWGFNIWGVMFLLSAIIGLFQSGRHR